MNYKELDESNLKHCLSPFLNRLVYAGLGIFGWLAMSMNRGNISNGANISDVTHKSSSRDLILVTIFLRALVAGPLLIFEGYKNIIKDNEIIENGNVNSITIADFLFLLLIVFQFI